MNKNEYLTPAEKRARDNYYRRMEGKVGILEAIGSGLFFAAFVFILVFI